MTTSKKTKTKVQPIMLVARDYIVTADGTRYEKGDELPPEVAKNVASSHIKEAE